MAARPSRVSGLGAVTCAIALAGCVAAAPSAPAIDEPPIRISVVEIPRVAAPPRDNSGRELDIDPVFARCAACHSLEPGTNGIGPSLAGVFGREAATQPRFPYSIGLSESGLVWDAATLDRWLAGPRELVPDSKMFFSGLHDPLDRAAVIAYLQRHSADQ